MWGGGSGEQHGDDIHKKRLLVQTRTRLKHVLGKRSDECSICGSQLTPFINISKTCVESSVHAKQGVLHQTGAWQATVDDHVCAVDINKVILRVCARRNSCNSCSS